MSSFVSQTGGVKADSEATLDGEADATSEIETADKEIVATGTEEVIDEEDGDDEDMEGDEGDLEEDDENDEDVDDEEDEEEEEEELGGESEPAGNGKKEK